MSSPKGPDAQAAPSNAGPRGAAADAERVLHTPGPWHVEKCDEGYRAFNAQDFAIIAENRITPALVWGSGFSEGRANARLIAAAPDMLKALKLLSAEGATSSIEAMFAVKAAIAIAEGRDV